MSINARKIKTGEYVWFILLLGCILFSVLFLVGNISILPHQILELVPENFDPVVVRFLLITALLSAPCLIARPELGLYLIVGYVPFQFWLRDLAGGSQLVGLLDDFVLALVATALLARVVLTQKIRQTFIDKFVIILVILTLLSTIINRVSLAPAIQGLRIVFEPFIFFYAIVYFCKTETMFKRLLLIFVLASFVQIPFAFRQYMSNPSGTSDLIVGTLGTGFSNTLGYFQAVTIFVLMGLGTFTRKKFYLLASAFFVPIIVMAGSRSVYFFLPFALLILYRKQIMRGFRLNAVRMTRAALVLLLLSLVMYFSVELVSSRYAIAARRGWPSFTELVEGQLNPQQNTGRLAWIEITMNTVRKESNLFWGLGPLMWGSKPASQEYSPIFRQTIENLYGDAIPSEIVVVMGEYGILVLLTFYMIFYRIYRYTAHIDAREISSFWRGICFALNGGVLVFAVGGFIQPTWFTQVIAYYVWLLAGGVYLCTTRFSSQ
ncbi:MAG: hypothetical protein GY845_38205 [Planctomycetes bacterium]|nr:hypothetical protein [Planctomycetota bacterium]